MMNNQNFKDDERQVIEAVEKFIAKEVRSEAQQLEKQISYPIELVRQMSELGLFGLLVPQEYGGLELRYEVFAAVMEKVAAGWATLAAYINSHATVAYLISKYGTTQQKAAFLPRMATGDNRGALCLTEPDAGSDLQSIKTIAIKNAGNVTLSGTKIFITNGRKANIYLTLVKTGQKDIGKPRLALLIVESTDPGVSVGSEFHKMAFNHVDTVEVIFDQAVVPEDRYLGGSNEKGLSQLLDGLEIGRIAIASSCNGLAAAALGDALKYAAERKTFGTTIDQHQAVQLRLADMATKLMAARLMTAEAAAIKQQGARADMLSAMAKLFASEACLEITSDAMRIHGGYGYVKEFAVERMFREAALYITGEGTSDINRLVIARRLKEGHENNTLGLPT